MTTLVLALKTEIARLARKEIRQELDSLKKASTKYRSEIASLKKQIGEMQKLLRKTPKEQSEQAGETRFHSRFSASGLKSFREKMGLSAAEIASLLDVSSAAVYSWETGKFRPRAAQIEKIAGLKKQGKKALKLRLDSMPA